jgi:cell division protein FtsN
MKWLFFILLLINGGLFVWIYPQIVEPDPEVVKSTGVERLRLLSELENSSPDELVQIDAGVAVTQQATPASKIALTTNESLSSSGAAPEKKVNTDRLSDTEFPIPIEDEKVEQESSPPITGSVMLNQDDQLPAVSELAAQSAPLLQCKRVGPLGKRAEADQLSLRLRAMGLQPDLNSEVSNNQEGYWVLVPPQKNRSIAISIVKRLQKAGITDLWRFTSGTLAHAISLGLFRNESRAEIRRKAIADKGFDVEVRPRYRQKTNYWLSYSFSGGSPLSDNKWQELLQRYPGMEQVAIECQEIATQ